MSTLIATDKNITDKITKLLKKAYSAKEVGSVEEADAFLAKANELLLRHNLEVGDIDLNDKTKKLLITLNSVSYHDNQAGSRWRLEFLQILCQYNFCDFVKKSWSSTGSYVNNHMADIIGQPENVDAVIYLYHNLSTKLLIVAQEAYKAIDGDSRCNRYGFLKDFLLGAVHGFRAKMAELRRAQEAEYTGINGLVLYNAAAIAGFIEERFPDVRKGKAYRAIKVDGETYRKGYKAGKDTEADKKAMVAKKVKALAEAHKGDDESMELARVIFAKWAAKPKAERTEDFHNELVSSIRIPGDGQTIKYVLAAFASLKKRLQVIEESK